MNRGKSSDLKRIEHSEDIELSFLRQVRAVGEDGEGDMHRQKLADARRE
jgi:hypothetical protein